MFDSRQDRARALGFGLALNNWPLPDGSLDSGDRAYLWGSFFSTFPPNPYHIDDHVAVAKALLIEQFKPRVNINKMVEVMATRVQGIENVASDLLTRRSIETAEGAQLDIIGEIVGQNREGRTDEEYRAAIKTRIQLNTSSGEPETLISALRFLSDPTDASYLEAYPGAVRLWTNGPSPPDNLGARMQAFAPAGVSVLVTITLLEPFVLGNVAGTPIPGTGGFSELESPTVGGQLAGIV